jgi:hypothetical protein
VCYFMLTNLITCTLLDNDLFTVPVAYWELCHEWDVAYNVTTTISNYAQYSDYTLLTDRYACVLGSAVSTVTIQTAVSASSCTQDTYGPFV